MRKRALDSRPTKGTDRALDSRPHGRLPLSLDAVERHAQAWLLDGKIRRLSPATLSLRQGILARFVAHLRREGCTRAGTEEIRQFMAYLAADPPPGGRWGNPRLTQRASSRTVQAYWQCLDVFFAWLAGEGTIDQSPVDGIRAPVHRPGQVQPFSPDEVRALLAAAKRGTAYPRRDEAIVLFLLDTGCRASEVCALTAGDLDLTGCKCAVQGKGDKRRMVYFSTRTARALARYLAEEEHHEEHALFLAERGWQAGKGLTRSGLRRLIVRLGKAAGLKAVRCTPHTFRHTFAVEFLRAGGNTFTLQQLLGHATLAMTNRYVALAQADLEAQHRRHSPVERLGA